MIDPVSGFEYPDAWLQACKHPEQLTRVKEGLAILTADGTILKRGFTTGTTAAAAAKAAVLSLSGTVDGSVDILTPSGIRVQVPATGSAGFGTCRKHSGDYPGDVTAGMRFHAKSERRESGCMISTGEGIGTWERENPRYPKGSPAISPPALDSIQTAITEAMEQAGIPGVHVCLMAEKGREIAEKTLNARIGVTGGISVLGSTGFVEPWDDHLELSFLDRISNAGKVVLTTGRVGLRFSRLLFPDYEVVLVGSRIGTALDKTSGEVILCGLPALILKYMNPHFLEGTGYGSVEEMIGTPVFDHLAEKTLSHFCREKQGVRVILLDRAGRIMMEAP